MAPEARRARFAVCAALLAVPLIVFGSCLFGGQAFVPADLLRYIAPWSHLPASSNSHPWNVLRFDGVTQFFPWRLEAARSIQRGRLPFWNPFAFAASGGTPLWANSQSAPLYPVNFLYYVFPLQQIWYVFGLAAAIQLEIAAAGTYLFLRRCIAVGRAPALLGAIAFALSAPLTCWLALPTFLSVACWIPWLLLLIHGAHSASDQRRIVGYVVGTGVVAGLMILGGHLQITLYGISLGCAYSFHCWLGQDRKVNRRQGYLRYAAAVAVVLIIALGLAAPQLLPSLELSRVSHRASAGFPTWGGYESYIANALPLRNLVTLLFPNFFGHPNWTGSIYWNSNNYGEWAMFAGVTPLLLCFFALGQPWRRGGQNDQQIARLRARGFFAGVAATAFLIASGSPLNIPLFFFLPGYSQTGNPGRILVVFVFAISILASLGLEALIDRTIDRQARERAVLVALGAPALIAAFGASRAAAFQRESVQGASLSALLAPAIPSLIVGASLFVLAGVLIVLAGRRSGNAVGYVLIAISAAELINWGWGYNPTVAAGDVYPMTAGIAYLQKNARSDDLIAPLNRGWSLSGAGPRRAALPPDGLTVFGLHDVSGYDSLFLRTAKDQVREAGDGLDPSPQENGNMVFVKDPLIAVRLGARYIAVAPEAPLDELPPGVQMVYQGTDLLIYENASAGKFNPEIGEAYAPASIRFGLFAALTVLGSLTAFLASAIASIQLRRRRQRVSRLL